MDKKSLVTAIIVGIVFPVFVLITSMECAVFNRGFFLDQLDKNNVSQTTGIASKELPAVTDQIFAFLKGEREDFNIYAEKENDLYVPLFNQEELIHMEDVRGLLKAAVIVQAVCGVLLLAGLALLFFWNRAAMAKAVFGGSVFGLVLLLASGLAAVFNFTAVFQAAHRLIFTNDYWYLDPNESVLINIVPEPYFIALGLRIVVIAAVVYLICAVSGGFFSRRLAQRKFMKNSKRKF